MFDRRFEIERPKVASAPSWYFREPVVVNCPWALAKISPQSLDAIAYIVQSMCKAVNQAQQPWAQLVFRLFTNSQPNHTLHLHVLKKRLEQRIAQLAPCLRGLPPMNISPVVIEVLPGMSIAAYLSAASRAHLMLDMFPYSGCLTVLVRRDACTTCARFSTPHGAIPFSRTRCMLVSPS